MFFGPKMLKRCVSNTSFLGYHTWKVGSALLCQIINKSSKSGGRHFQKQLLKNWLLITNIEFYSRLNVFFCFFFTFFVDFIFVDFDKILYKFIYLLCNLLEYYFFADPAFEVRYSFMLEVHAKYEASLWPSHAHGLN